MEDEKWYWRLLTVEFIFAGVVALALGKKVAPYGRHSVNKAWSMAAREGWVIMESPALWASLIFFSFGSHSQDFIPNVLFRFFQVHYLHRTLVFPLRIHSQAKQIPIFIVALSFAFNIFNSYIQARWISEYGSYPSSWLTSPQFITGSVIFAAGMVINIWADSVLLSLRNSSGGRYKMPTGWLFTVVVCPNYLGEIVEWLGWAILTWSPAGLAFFVFTAANLIPRALAHRGWYLTKFSDFPRSRSSVIPLLI